MTAPVVVIGGGIAGLTVAYDLHRTGIDAIVLEASPRAGGRLQTTPVGDLTIDSGPDAYLERVPGARELVAELGLGAQVVHPSARRALLSLDGRRVAIPEANVLGVPLDLDAIAGSGLLTPSGLQRAKLDLDSHGPPLQNDTSVGAVVRERLGDEVFERLVDPLLSGINAGNADEISVELGAPQLAAAAREGGSLIAALTRQRSTVSGPTFSSLAGGVQVLVDALAARLAGRVHMSVAVREITRRERTWRVTTSAGDFEAEHVVVATPAHVAAKQLEGSPTIASRLAEVRFASVVLVTLVLPAGSMPTELAGFSGLLVPRSAGHLMTACSFATEKWPHWSRRGEVVLRVSAGRIDDDRSTAMNDDDLVEALRRELAEVVGIDAEHHAVRVSRWPRSLAQLPPGHAEWLRELDRAVDTAPGLALVGASYEGVGIPATIRRARRVAAVVAADLAPQQGTPRSQQDVK